MLRLVAYAPNGAQRFPLGSGRLLLGRSSDCDLVLDHDGVEDLHAVLERDLDQVRVTAAGSAVVLHNGRPRAEFVAGLLDEIGIGPLALVVEDSAERAEKKNRSQAPTAPSTARQDLTVALVRQRLLEHLAALSSWVLSDSGSNRSLESVLGRLLDDFGGGVAMLFEGLPERDPAVKLLVTQDGTWLTDGEALLTACRRQAKIAPGRTFGHFHDTIGGRDCLLCFRAVRALNRDYFGVIAIPELPFDHWSPDSGFATVFDLVVLGLVHHVGRYEPILPGRGEPRELVLAPGLVLGPSPRMARLVETLQATADTPSNVLLLGETGTARELLARSLHASGPHRRGPFIVADCDGLDERQLEAELFGAEVAGRAGPVRREGKLSLARDGTLFLRNVEELPLALQSRLLHALREGTAKEGKSQVFGLVCASGLGFYDRLAADRLRVDLAARVAQVVVPVPALRERTEDLPLLLQVLVNRFSHETGKRVRGITTRALEALAEYPFPGNLAELENSVRQMIYIAREESPLDVELLPPQIRSARLRSSSATGPAELAEVVARVEREAIARALEETEGNKARAARLLGISRNGLAQKMKRYLL